MGVVWRAYDRVLDRNVAFKVLHDELFGTAHQERLATEARLMAKLTHPNVVAVYDVGERDGRTFVTMELVRGESIASWLRTPRTWREVVVAFRAAADGVAAAHAEGIVHRDLKPSNILIGEDGRVRVADFGVAGPEMTPKPGVLVTQTTSGGTPAYMAPERLDGAPGDVRSDQFSFGVALYEALNGRLPFDGTDEVELRAAMNRPPPRTSAVPARVTEVIERAIAAAPQARFASMEELGKALDRAMRGPRWLVPAIGGAVLAIAGGVAIAMRGGSVEPCSALDGHVTAFWSPAVRAQIGMVFLATGGAFAPASWERAAIALDRHAARWIDERTKACRATRVHGEQPAEVLAARNACLDAQLGAMRRTIAILHAPDVKLIGNATQMIEGLAAPSTCATARAADPATTATRAEIALADAQIAAGRHRDAKASADRALVEARAKHDDGLEASALLVAGRVAASDARLADAEQSYLAAIAAATRVNDTRLLAWIWIRLSLVQQRRQAWEDATNAVAEGIEGADASGDQDARAEGHNALGTLHARRGRYGEAVKEFERALEIRVAAFGEDSVRSAPYLNNLASAYRQLAQFDKAIAINERAVVVVSPLGSLHPDVIRTRRDLGVLYSATFDARAEKIFTDALADATAPGSQAPGPLVGLLHSDLGTFYARTARRSLAREHFEKALALLHVDERFEARSALAEMLVDDGDERGVAMFRELLGEAEQRYGATHTRTAQAHLQLGGALRDLEQWKEADEELARAEAGFRAAVGDDNPKLTAVLVSRSIMSRLRGEMARAVELGRVIVERAEKNERDRVLMYRAWFAFDLLAIGKRAEAIRILEAAERDQHQHLAHTTSSLIRFVRAHGLRPVEQLAAVRSAREELAAQTANLEKAELWLLSYMDRWIATHGGTPP